MEPNYTLPKTCYYLKVATLCLFSTVPISRKPHGYKILKLNLSLQEIQGGPAGQLNTVSSKAGHLLS